MAGAESWEPPTVLAAVNPAVGGAVAPAGEAAVPAGAVASAVAAVPRPAPAATPTSVTPPPVVAAAVRGPLPHSAPLSLPATRPAPPAAVARPPAKPPQPLPRPGAFVRWECAAALVAASLTQPWPVAVAATLAAAGLGGSTVRVRNRSLTELAARGLGYLGRPRDLTLPPHERAAALLDHLLPAVSFGATELGGVPVLVIRHAGGVAAVTEPTTTGPRWVSPAVLLPEAGPDGPYPGVQGIFHAGGEPGSPPRRWFGVHAVRTAEHADDELLTLVLRNTLRRVLRGLAQHGVPAEPLGREAGLATIAALAHVTGGRTELREDWARWRTGPVSQVCFRLDGWHALPGPVTERLVAGLLSRPAGVAVTLAAQARRTPRGSTTSAALRLAARSPTALDAALPGLARWCAGHGLRLHRLDGHHLAGVTATLPIGGTSK